VEPTGKRFLLAVDVSGSMSCPVSGSNISCACAAAAMTMVTMKTEQNYHVLGFSTHLVPIRINSKMRLDDVMNTIMKVRPLQLYISYIIHCRSIWVEQIVLNQCCGQKRTKHLLMFL